MKRFVTIFMLLALIYGFHNLSYGFEECDGLKINPCFSLPEETPIGINFEVEGAQKNPNNSQTLILEEDLATPDLDSLSIQTLAFQKNDFQHLRKIDKLQLTASMAITEELNRIDELLKNIQTNNYLKPSIVSTTNR